jgi:hypothetical protein
MDGQLPQPPLASVAPPQPSLAPAATPAARISLLAVLVLGLLISAGGALLYWQTSRLKAPAETAAVVATATPAADTAPAAISTPTAPKPLVYDLPPGWTEQPAEGDLTPYYSFLKRLRSPDDCNLVVVARFRTDNLSLNDFLATQYPGKSITELRHSEQPSFAGQDSFTVKPQADGESFSTFIKTNGYVYGLFASYSLDAQGETLRCGANPPELAPLLNSVTLQ